MRLFCFTLRSVTLVTTLVVEDEGIGDRDEFEVFGVGRFCAADRVKAGIRDIASVGSARRCSGVFAPVNANRARVHAAVCSAGVYADTEMRRFAFVPAGRARHV